MSDLDINNFLTNSFNIHKDKIIKEHTETIINDLNNLSDSDSINKIGIIIGNIISVANNISLLPISLNHFQSIFVSNYLQHHHFLLQ